MNTHCSITCLEVKGYSGHKDLSLASDCDIGYPKNQRPCEGPSMLPNLSSSGARFLKVPI